MSDQNAISIPAHEFTRMQNDVARLRTLEASRAAELLAADARAAIARGEVDAVVRQTQQRVAEAEDRARGFAIESEIARSLSQHSLVAGGAAQVSALLKGHFTADPAGNSFAIRSRDGRAAADYVAAKLGSDEFAHFRSAGATGPANPATGQPTMQPSPPVTIPPQFASPTNFSEAMIAADLARRAQRQQWQSTPTTGWATDESGNPRKTAMPSFGLRGKR